ncbi:BUB3-interacting and GLEBS motif-containing protein ZNF207 [Parasteatoda tepidariorum]|uniref:BUB3-interacting and GLEBS motif-containing protein ZNF207 n=1 Tax=Parasteatoda tepidariorum TaxID=114398 RepID=UPI00077FCBDA
MGRKKKKPSKPWCWYCNREFEDEKILIQHQKAKHFKCHICFKKLYTGPGLAIHCMQVHKEVIKEVPNAQTSRNSVDVEIYGMEGIPEDDVRLHVMMRQGDNNVEVRNSDDEDSSGLPDKSSGPTMPGMPSMPGMMPGMPPIPGMMPGMPGMGFPMMPGQSPLGPMGPMDLPSSGLNKGMPPGFMPPGGMPMMPPGMPRAPIMPPSTVSGSTQAPSKPLFPSAMPQTSTSSSQSPVGTDFKPLMTMSSRPTFPAYSGSSSPNVSASMKSHSGVPVSYSAEASLSPQTNPDAKRLCTAPPSQTSTASSKIMHPDEDVSLEEKRSIMPKYIMHLPGMPPMMGGKGLQNPVMMNGMQMMRPSMGMPPNMSGGGMPRMGSPYSGQSMFPQGGSFPMMGQGGSRPY